MSALQIKKAVRSKVWMKLAVTGPSGSGKTYSALRMAHGIGLKVAVIDTENDSASLYADKFDFDVVSLPDPFTPQRYTEALAMIVEAGYEVVVIDSISHEWAHAGGILDVKAQKDARGGNGYTNWMDMKRVHQKFVDAILQSKIHVICTVRSKTEYVLETNDKGKQVPKKVGLGLIQAPELEYEFTAVFDVDRDSHLATTSKDRTSLFAERCFLITEDIGKELKAWRESGAEPAPLTRTFDAPDPEQDPEGYRAKFGEQIKEDTAAVRAQPKAEMDPATAAWVNDVADGPLDRSTATQAIEPEEVISTQDYDALNAALALYPETQGETFRHALRNYASLEAQLAPSPKPTLARWRREPFARFMAALADDAVRPGMAESILQPF